MTAGISKFLFGSDATVNDYSKDESVSIVGDNNIVADTLVTNDFTSETSLMEYLFVNDYAYIQAITDSDDKVIIYAVTNREGDFNPTLHLPIGYDITLGENRFIELDEFDQEPEWVRSFLGAHNFYYSEEYYFGNPGYYQTYIFALAGAGFLGLDSDSNTDLVVPPGRRNVDSANLDDPDVNEFRNKALINTYVVTSPLLGSRYEFNGTQFGPDDIQVRVLKSTQKNLSKEKMLINIDKLSTEVNISIFKNLLGEPAIVQAYYLSKEPFPPSGW